MSSLVFAPAHWLSLAVCCISLLVAAPAVAKEPERESPSIWLGQSVELRPSMQYRPRAVLDSGRDFASGNNRSFVEHRARVGVELRLSDWVSGLVEVWDVRLWGEEGDVIGDDRADGIDVRRVWVELRTPGGGALSLRVGRQQPGFIDDQRLIAPAVFNQSGRTFDGLLLRARGKRWQGALFWWRIAESDAGMPLGADAPQPDRNYAGLWLQMIGRLSLHFLYDDNSDQDLRRFTVGAFYRDAHDFGLRYTFDAYYQTGASGSASSRKRIHAFLLGGRLGYQFKIKSKLSVMAAADWLSGDKNPDDDTDRAFNTLFNAGHRHYGLMDYFLAQPRDNGGRGLFDGGVRIKIWPHRRVDIVAQYHHFRFTAPWIEADGRRTNAVGNELDLQATLRLHRYFAIRAAFGAFTPERGVTCVRGGCRSAAPTEYLSYLQLDLDIR